MPPVPTITFKTTSVTPPKIVRKHGRVSPYAPPEMVPGFWDSLKKARVAADKDEAASPWVTFFEGGLPSEQSSRTALMRIREAVTKHAELGDPKKLAGRTWKTGEEGSYVWHFALSVRPGVL
jgi:hypothetical protein